ncbi:hypothetical protein [Spirosoma flavum]|uniref:Uncharacterized protein n=1 Tax=Spirosoma flavum TaxID=2048557 RepID=A0ABW6AHS3_9BACT
MSAMKIITIVNWVLMSIYGAFPIYAIINANPYNDAGGKEQALAINIVGLFLLLILIVLNTLSYDWTKIVALVLEILLLLLMRYIITH